MDDKSLESFFGLDNQPKNIDKIQKLENTRFLMKRLCQSLASEPNEFGLEKTVALITDFIGDKDRYLDRFLYSELSMQLFDFDVKKRDKFFSNIATLLENFATVVDEETEDEDLKSIEKMIIKIYDHTHLVEHQIGMIERSVESGKKSIQEANQKELKSIQKDYIAILSVFSAVVLAFSGGLTFSASVLENISAVSMYRLVFIALLIGIVLLNLFFGLFYHIKDIIGLEHRFRPLILVNAVFLLFMFITFVFWNCGVIEKRNERIPQQPIQENTENVEVEVVLPE